MKCPKCNREVPEGNLFCPHCLEEIPWVKEFDTVETRLEKKRLETDEKPKEPEDPEDPEDPFHSDELDLPALLHRHPVLGAFSGLILAGMAIGLVFFYRNLQEPVRTFEDYYSSAVSLLEKQDYEKAMQEVQAAINLRPNDLSANMLLAEILDDQGDDSSAFLVLKPMLTTYPENPELYRTAADVLFRTGNLKELESLLQEIRNPDILAACRAYICDPPKSSVASGTYTTRLSIELTADTGSIYYTMDGSAPSRKNGYLYQKPLLLSREGTTVLNAVTVNENGIVSAVSSWKYVLVLDSPSAPVVTPEGGEYYTDTKIEIQVPEGCTAYYAFDEVPDETSTKYVQPISMPLDYHTFYAILVAANGKVSEVTKVNYYLEYQ